MFAMQNSAIYQSIDIQQAVFQTPSITLALW